MPSILNATTSSGLVTSADNSGSLQLATNNGTTAVTIDTSQNVGIGTASPSGRLGVIYTNNTAYTTSGFQTQGVFVGNDSTTAGTPASLYFRVTGNGGTTAAGAISLVHTADGSGALAFQTRNSGTNAEQARITSAGLMQFNSGYGSVATAYGCRAWVNFDGTGTVAIRGSANVSSITDNSTGDYTVNFTNAMPDVNYSATIGTPTTAGGGALFLAALANVGGWTTSRIFIRAINSNLTYWDPEIVCVAIHR